MRSPSVFRLHPNAEINYFMNSAKAGTGLRQSETAGLLASDVSIRKSTRDSCPCRPVEEEILVA